MSETAIRKTIATLPRTIAEERAATVERVERLRRFADGDHLKQRERDEWDAFHRRVRRMERELEYLAQMMKRRDCERRQL
jgi:hypothetical protein